MGAVRSSSVVAARAGERLQRKGSLTCNDKPSVSLAAHQNRVKTSYNMVSLKISWNATQIIWGPASRAEDYLKGVRHAYTLDITFSLHNTNAIITGST